MNTQQELAERLDAIRERLDNEDFLNNRGLGNEIGFYIFDFHFGCFIQYGSLKGLFFSPGKEFSFFQDSVNCPGKVHCGRPGSF